MITVNKVDKSVGFLTEYGDMGMATLRSSYVGITSAMKQKLVAGALWQSAVYDIKGQMQAHVRRISEQKIHAGYINVDKDQKKSVYHAEAGDEAPLSDVEWITAEGLPFGGMSDQLGGPPSQTATAVEEQSTTTAEIAGKVAQASQGIQEVNEMASQSTAVAAQVSDSLSDVDQTTTEMSARSREVRRGTEGLSEMAAQLNGLVGRFKV